MLTRGKSVKAKARMAAAWATPDTWSSGYSQAELAKVLRELLEYTEYLEKKYKHKEEQIFDL
jgi:hypothetical protein